jgi:CBS domain containing-hemolysin-like protein
MTSGDLWSLFWVALLVIAAAAFAASEAAVVRMTRVRAMALADEGKRGANFLVRITQDPARYLNPVLFATLACHVIGTTLATTVAVRHLGSAGEWVTTAVLTSILFVFAESMPKTYAILRTDAAALRLAPLIYGLGRALYPLARGLVGISNVILPGKGLPKGPFMSEDEIRRIVDVAESEEVIERQEREMIHSIFEFGDTVVRNVMTPRPDMIVVKADTSVREAMDLAIDHGFSRIPVFDDEPDNIVGVVYAKDLFKALRRNEDDGKTVRDVMREPFFVPETMRVSDLLRDMQAKHMHMAIVVDEYGDVAGLVTLEDLLEEIVGEITDEYDVEESRIMPVGDGWLVQGKMPIWELNELIGSDLPEDEEWQTVGGLVSAALGRIPEPGDEVTFHGFNFRVDKVQRRRIGSVLVRRVSDEAPRELLAQ